MRTQYNSPVNGESTIGRKVYSLFLTKAGTLEKLMNVPGRRYESNQKKYNPNKQKILTKIDFKDQEHKLIQRGKRELADREVFS